MNKIMQRALILNQASLLTRRSPQYMFLLQASQRVALTHQARLFHAGGGHNHDHSHDDDGKQSHSDFQTKSKKPLDENALNAQFTEWI